MKKFLVLVLMAGNISSFAQKKVKPETYAKTISPADLKERLYIVASADMQGRETATEGQRKAAAYIEAQFKSLGLQPGNGDSYQLFYNVYQDSLTGAKLEVNGKEYQMNTDFNVSLNDIPATMRFSEVVFVGANSTDSLKNVSLAGKAVMIIGGLPQRFSRGRQTGIYETLVEKGAAAILSVASNYPGRTTISRKGFPSLSLFRRNITPQLFTVSENVAKAILGNDYDPAKSILL